MFRFPMFGYPYNYQYYKYNNNFPMPISPCNASENIIPEKNSITNSNKISNTINQNSSNNSEQAILEIFGIKLYLDDLMILGILFFLYQQNVKDEMLYIILFLLLFS